MTAWYVATEGAERASLPLPRAIGPFADRASAEAWAEREIADGSWLVAPLSSPDRWVS